MSESNGNPVGERLVAVEFQSDRALELAKTALANQEAILSKLDTINSKMDEINLDIIRYKGFIGGVALVLTGIGLVITFFKGWFFAKMGIPT